MCVLVLVCVCAHARAHVCLGEQAKVILRALIFHSGTKIFKSLLALLTSAHLENNQGF